MWGGNERKETKMTQTLAWAAEWVLASCAGMREEAQPEISSSCAVFGILWKYPYRGRRACSSERQHLDKRIWVPPCNGWHSRTPSVKNEPSRRRVPVRVPEARFQRAEGERVAKKRETNRG